MANGFAKAWKYVSAWFSAKVDEKADPKIQIQQAIEEAQRQHARLNQQAATVIGNQHQLELQLDRKLSEIEQLQAQARQALVLADQARADGDEAKAAEFEETASMLAGQLVTAEAAAAQLKQLHDQSLGAAQQAKQAVQDNAQRLQEKLAERTKLLSQLEQAKMQEQVAASLSQVSELSAPKNTPSLDEVRDKIERRYANALGQAELASSSTQGRLNEVKKATVDLAAQARLAEIRAGLGQGSAGHGSAGQGSAGQGSAGQIAASRPVLDKATPAISEAPAATPEGQPTQHEADPAG